jgi:hypothetical protein
VSGELHESRSDGDGAEPNSRPHRVPKTDSQSPSQHDSPGLRGEGQVQTTESDDSILPEPRVRGYLAELHLPLVVILFILCIVLAALGFDLRPGTHRPPPVPPYQIRLSGLQASTKSEALRVPTINAIYDLNRSITLLTKLEQQRHAYTMCIIRAIDTGKQSSCKQQQSPPPPLAITSTPTELVVDETLLQKSSSTVQLQLDLLGASPQTQTMFWILNINTFKSQPYLCPDVHHYVGTAYQNPYASTKSYVTIAGHHASAAIIKNFEGLFAYGASKRTLGISGDLTLVGESPGEIPANALVPVGEVNLCWNRNAPLKFNGEYATAALPGISENNSRVIALIPHYTGHKLTLTVTQNLYFQNPLQSAQPTTSEYSLQAGSLPTRTDPFGWHWSGNSGTLIQLTALNIVDSQHAAYLGFISGVMFGIAGGAFVALLHETLEPIRRRRSVHNIGVSSKGSR